MAETKLTAFQKEQVETSKKILSYKLAAEANIVGILYQNPEDIYSINLPPKDFHNEVWRIYYQIATDIILVEKKNTLDDITVGLYLEKHPKLKKKYQEFGEYETIYQATGYVKRENLEGYILELKKWNAVLQLCKVGFPVKDNLSDYVDMSEEEIYNELETQLNHTFINATDTAKSYNIFEGMAEFIEELNKGEEVGLPLYNSELLTKEIGGFNLNGNVYGLGGTSGAGKSTMAFNYIIPSAINYNEKVVFIINEEDERKFKKEMLIWVANNIFKKELHKYTIRDGNFTSEVLDLLKQCSKWIEDKKENHTFTVVPLEHYSVNIAVKLIKKYASALGVRIFVLDTLKESFDATTDEIYKSMMRDMVTLYNTVKPVGKNVGLLVTYQLGKNSYKTRHLTNTDIGQAKSIIDVMSVNLMMRRPFEDEYEGGSKELICYKFEGKSGKSKIPFKLKRDNNYMITFITKNRFGETDTRQIISECDLSTNVYRDIGYANVPQDW